MAQPKTEFYELHPIYTTYKANSAIVFNRTLDGYSADTGKAVTKNTVDREVILATAGLQIQGKLIKVEPDNHCTIHEGRYIELQDDGTAIAINDFVCGGATAGRIRAVGAATFRNAQVVAQGSAADLWIVKMD